MTVSGLVAAGLGVALLPLEEPAVRGPQPGPVLVPLADPGAARAVGLIWSADAVPGDAVRTFREFAVEWSRGSGR
ncbi:LysR substrate binding domain [Nocardia africana]|uniref:LysR substrate binding domain n=1 Tax=Nocardia africana TaxID=134964 RepID=A0A378X034_9NOCA|nr:LysR substrate binding domain [Nocardia africana]